ncbi:putative metal-binding protein [Flammeovirga kamogawensis]|nr:putative metal-binding protein [Flammeovirga kamogawensis]
MYSFTIVLFLIIVVISVAHTLLKNEQTQLSFFQLVLSEIVRKSIVINFILGVTIFNLFLIIFLEGIYPIFQTINVRVLLYPFIQSFIVNGICLPILSIILGIGVTKKISQV